MADYNSAARNAKRKYGKKKSDGWQYDVGKMRMVPQIEQRDFIRKAVAQFLTHSSITMLKHQDESFFTGREISMETDAFLRGE